MPSRVRSALASSLVATALAVAAHAGEQGSEVTRGEYLFHASLCAVCHTAEEGEFLAGGRPIPTGFGTFYSTNITPHREHGIGSWSDEDFIRALRKGISPQGDHYYPVFPYTAYTKLRRDDILAIKAYLETVEPVARPNRPHDLDWYVSWRWPLGLWKGLYFEEGEFERDPDRSDTWNRGAYLAEAATHCAECHTPRNLLGALQRGVAYSGIEDGPEGESMPNITPHDRYGIGDWNADMLTFYLEIGMTPDGDFAGSLMAKVIDEGTTHLTPEDRQAIAEYILALPPLARP